MLVLAYVGPHWAKRVTFLGTAPGPGGPVGCILSLCWLTLSHMGGPSWAKRYISRHRVVLAYVGPHWAKRVTFLGTAPGQGGHVGCILGLCWLTLSHMGGPSWAKRYISRHRAQSRWACWVHIGLVLAYVGPHGRAVVGQEGCISRHRAYVGLHGRAVVAQEGCISRHRAWSRWACWVHIGRVLAYVGPDWAKRVTFLGTAPGPGGHVVLAYVEPHGRAVVGQEVHF